MIPSIVARAKAVLFLDGLRDDNLTTQDAMLVLSMAMAMVVAQSKSPTFAEEICAAIGPAVGQLAKDYAAEYDLADERESHGMRRTK